MNDIASALWCGIDAFFQINETSKPMQSPELLSADTWYIGTWTKGQWRQFTEISWNQNWNLLL